MDNITTAVVTLITVLFSAGAWKFYETKMKLKSELMKGEKTDQNMYRDDLRERVRNLERLLNVSADEKDEMRQQIFEKENERLRNV
jgi:hypothetical protein